MISVDLLISYGVVFIFMSVVHFASTSIFEYVRLLVLVRKVRGSSKELTASHLWLNRWKKQCGIHEKLISGERFSADHIAAKNLIKACEMLVNDNFCIPDQIYNIVETVLITDCCHINALAPIQEKSVSGIKVAKEGNSCCLQ
jgi:hypothetical protein